MLEGHVEAIVSRILVDCPQSEADQGGDVDGNSREAEHTGSGALPTLAIPSLAVAVQTPAMSAAALARALRRQPVAVFTVIRDGRVLFDVRTTADSEVAAIAAAVAAVLNGA